jgi:hypothetical protein
MSDQHASDRSSEVKDSIANIEIQEAGEIQNADILYARPYDPKETKRLVRKIDLYLIPLLALLYL